MPVGPGRYRVTTTSSGKKIRLHITPSGKVNEAKNLETGAVHTPKEFMADKHKNSRSKSSGSRKPKSA